MITSFFFFSSFHDNIFQPTMIQIKQAATILLCLCFRPTSGFGIVASVSKHASDRLTSQSLSSVAPGAMNEVELLPGDVNIVERYFQFEEKEDSETRMSGILLHANQTISLLVSDIPCHKETSGTWEQDDKGRFFMTLNRSFSAGRKEISETDMGQFIFSMERSYTGVLTFVGSRIAVDGFVHIQDELFGDEKVGFFSMIDLEIDPNEQGEFVPSGMASKATQR